jgi:DNA-binding NarL/FixJ family response regulator
MPRLRVLICDDAVLFATMLRVWFEGDPDVEVVGVTESAREGVAEAGRCRPDVIVLDHLLPDGRSPEVIPQLRAQVPDVAVVLISGLAGDVLAVAAAEVGAQGWISKASTQDEVRAEILRAGRAA